jgi:hypothetical protein
MVVTPRGAATGSQPEAKIVILKGSPEETADELIAPSLPRIFLDQIDLRSAEGPHLLVESLSRRRFEASVERAELIGFVERNRAVLENTGVLDSFVDMAEPAIGSDRRGWLDNLIDQMKRVLDGHPERVDLISSRLLWLCVALGYYVSGGRLDHAAAVEVLRRPHNRERITHAAVMYLLIDYIDNMDKLDEQRPEYALLLAECALLADDKTCMNTAAGLLHCVPPGADTAALLTVWHQLRRRLAAAGAWTADHQAALDRIVARFDSGVPDDDF